MVSRVREASTSTITIQWNSFRSYSIAWSTKVFVINYHRYSTWNGNSELCHRLSNIKADPYSDDKRGRFNLS
jgi:hypothetical protein